MPIKSRTIELSIDNRKERLVLPVNPQEIAIDTASLNQHVQLLTVGEANLLGPRGLASTSLSGFFPAQGSPFYRFADRSPQSYVSTLKRWRDACKPVRLIISDMGVNLAMAIESLQFTYREGSRDISYSIQLAEYRQLNVPTVKVAVKPSGPPLRWYPAPIRCAPATVCGRSPSGTMAMGPSGSVSITPTGLRYAILT